MVVEAKVSSIAGKVTQKEIFYFVREGDRWLINELVVTDDEIDVDKIQL